MLPSVPVRNRNAEAEPPKNRAGTNIGLHNPLLTRPACLCALPQAAGNCSNAVDLTSGRLLPIAGVVRESVRNCRTEAGPSVTVFTVNVGRSALFSRSLEEEPVRSNLSQRFNGTHVHKFWIMGALPSQVNRPRVISRTQRGRYEYMNLAEKLAAYCASFSEKTLPEAAIHEAKRRVIDSVGCAMGAYLAEPPKIAREIARTATSDYGATVIGTAHQSTPELAAFANGVMFRYLDFNDTYLSKEPAHPSDNIAALLAIAEAFGSDGSELISAIVLSYEIQCRLCDAYSIRKQGWDHVTYGSFSTLAGCGHLLGFSEEQFVHGFGLAATPNNAMRITRAGELSMWKGCAFANASRNGVFAAMLAHLGMTGPAPIFEGEMAFFDEICRGDRFDIPKLGGQSGEPYMINKTYIKKYPAEYHSQSAIDAALEIVDDHGGVFEPAEIDSIQIETFTASWEIIAKDPEKSRPKSRETADHSLQYITCAALVDGEIWTPSFEEERFTDEELLSLVAKTKVIAHAPYDDVYPERGIPNRVTVTLTDGKQYVKEAVSPKGHALNPMTDDEVLAKFRRQSEPLLRESQIAAGLNALWELESEADLSSMLANFVV